MKSGDTIVTIASTSFSVTFSIKGFGLMLLPLSTVVVSGLSLGNEVLYEAVFY